MATTPISNLPPVNGLDGSELMVVVQSGITSRSTVQMVADRAQGLVPSGGLTGQVLTKSSDLDFALEWANGGGGSGSLVVGTTEIDGGANGRVLFDNDGFLGEYVISGTGNVAMTTSPVFTTPNLGTPSAAVLTNATGLPIASGVSGLGTGVATFLATPSSANLAFAVTDETGTGLLVFATSPTLVTPNLGTPSALTLTNATGLPLSTGVTGTLPLASGGTGSSLTDPGADRIGFWDDSAGEFTWLTVGANLSITGTTLNATGGGGGTDIDIGSTVITGGSTGQVLYDNGGVAGEYAVSGSGSVAMTNSPAFTTPNLGTPSAATLTNATGLPISTGVSGLGSGIATFLATPSSANLAAAVTDETGSGALVFATSPTLVTPTLGTPASGTLTNCTGLPIASGVSGLGTGVATFLATPSSANLKAAVTDETGSGALVFATSPSFLTGISITGAASSLLPAIATTQTAAGTVATETSLNTVTISTDVADAVKVNGFNVTHNFGGSATKGGRHAFRAWVEITAATASDNPDRNYAGAHMRAQASSADNGTSGSEKGAFFGMNPEAVASSGATNLLELTSGECNVAAKTGSSVKYKAGLTIVARNDDAVQGSTYDCSLGLSNQTGAVGFNDGFLFGPMNGQFPLTSSGNLMRTIGGSFANGIDLSNSTISLLAFASPNFKVAGDGTTTVGLGRKFKLDPATGASGFQMGNTATGNPAQVDLDPLTGDGTSQAQFRFFRSTNTSGATFFSVLKGNNSSTENCRFHGQGTNSFACADNGNFGVGNNAPTSKLQVSGPIATAAPATKTADYTVTASDASIICNGSGAIALTLPAASGCAGRWLTVKTIAAQAVNSASSNVVPLVGGSAGTAILTGTAGKWARLQSDGTNWVIMEGN